MTPDPIITRSACVLQKLRYNITYPLAPSFFLVSLICHKNSVSPSKDKCPVRAAKRHPAAMREAEKVLWGFRVAFAATLLVKWVVGRWVWPVENGVPQSYGLSLFFYFALHIIVAAQQNLEKTHLLTASPLTHLTLWILHSFTFTVILASTASFIIYPTDGVDPSASADVALVCWGIGLELLLSAWKVHAALVAFTGAWSCVIAAAVVVYKTTVPDMPVGVSEAMSSAMQGLGLIVTSFVLLWAVGDMRDTLFPTECWDLGCGCKMVLDDVRVAIEPVVCSDTCDQKVDV
ncbi:hypothetical protein BC830DRAFT_1097631 [Chytriomyces sp. MP71]|nr:hypothetical protein BC830DRAFT_1097631 [Chytriomyces sp. MP71]